MKLLKYLLCGFCAFSVKALPEGYEKFKDITMKDVSVYQSIVNSEIVRDSPNAQIAGHKYYGLRNGAVLLSSSNLKQLNIPSLMLDFQDWLLNNETYFNLLINSNSGFSLEDKACVENFSDDSVLKVMVLENLINPDKEQKCQEELSAEWNRMKARPALPKFK